MLLTQGHLHEYRDNLITHTNVRDNGEREETKEEKNYPIQALLLLHPT